MAVGQRHHPAAIDATRRARASPRASVEGLAIATPAPPKRSNKTLGFCFGQRDDAVVATPPTRRTAMTTNQIPATQNHDWGFTGSLNEQAEAAWPIAMTTISNATCQPLESVRCFLDSRHGRHFADDVLNLRHACQQRM